MDQMCLISRGLRNAVLALVAVAATLISGCVTITNPTGGNTGSNQVPVSIHLNSAYCNNLKVTLDSADVTQFFTVTGNQSVTGNLNILTGGSHTLTASANTQQYWLLFPMCLNGYDGTDTKTFSVPSGQVVYVVSQSPNQILQFLVSPNGTLVPLNPAATTTQTGLTFPVVDPKGKHFYAVPSNGGTVYHWTINSDGTLTSAAPALTSAPAQIRSLVIDPTAQFAYISAVGAPGTTNISSYSIGPDGSFNNLNSNVSVSGLASLKMHPGGHLVFAFGGGVGGAGDTIYGFGIGSNGSLTPTNPASFVAPTAIGCSAFDPTGNFYYMATSTGNAAQSAILQFSVSSGGSLLPLSPASVSVPPTSASPLRGPACPVVDPVGRFVYASNGNQILNYRLNADGTLLALGTSSSGGNDGFQLVIDKTGQFMYVNHNFSHNITQFSVPATGGAPTALTPAIVPPITPGGAAPTGSLVNTWVGTGPP